MAIGVSSSKGVCIEYNMDKLNIALKNKIFPVLYSNKRIEITEEICTSDNVGLLKNFVYKSDHWKYEEEWRYININNFSNESEKKFINLKKHISKIIIGAESKNNDQLLEIIDWCSKNNITYVKTIINPKKYEIIEVNN